MPPPSTPQAVLDSHLECGVCISRLEDPRLLPCQHSFCLHCLQRLLEKAAAGYDGTCEFIQCPVCRQEAHLPMPGKANSLPKNLFLAGLLEALGRVEEEQKAPSSICSDCQREDAEIVCSCVTCAKVLCLQCKAYHKIAIGTKDHILSDELPASRPTAAAPQPTPVAQIESKCSAHGKPHEVYCRTCKVLICSMCVTVGQHGGCSRGTLEEVSQECAGSLRSILQEVTDSCEAPLLGALGRYEQAVVTLDESASNATHEVEVFCDELLLNVKARRQTLLARIEEVCNHQRSKFQDFCNQLKQDIEELNAITKDSDQTLKQPSLSNMIVECRGKKLYLKQTMDRFKGKFAATYQCGGSAIPISFQPPVADAETSLCSLIAKAGSVTPGLGHVSKIKAMVGVGVSTKVTVVECGISDDLAVTVKNPAGQDLAASDVAVKLVSGHDGHCERISTGTVQTVAYEIRIKTSVPGKHQLYVKIDKENTDGSPFTLHSFDMSTVVPRAIGPTPPRFLFGTATSFLQSPMGVAVSSTNTLFVADTGNHVVKEVTVDGKEGSPMRIHDESEPCAVACSPDGLLYVADRAERCIHVLTDDGKHVRSFGGAVSPAAELGALFRPCSIAISESYEIVVSDKGNGWICVFSNTGHLRRTITTLNRQGSRFVINNPAQVTVDTSSGLVYLAERGGGCVRVFNWDGECVASVGEGILNKPTGVAVHASGVIVVAHMPVGRATYAIVVFDKDGRLLSEITGGLSLKGPVSLSTGGSGMIVAADAGGNCVYCFGSV